MSVTERYIFVLIAVILFSFNSNITFAQQTEPSPAIVIVQRDFLRTLPSKLGRSETLVVEGAKLKVTPASNAKGWYFAYLEEAPSVGGYIHGNSIKIIKIRINAPKVSKNSTSEKLPKGIILDTSPDLDINEKSTVNKSKVISQSIAEKNYCIPSLYCPDIDQVQVIMFENKDKFQKGKFEKTSEWEKRKTTTLNTIKLNKNKTAGDTLYFLANDYSEPEYNADKELWTFDLGFRETYSQTCIPIISSSSGQEFCLVIPYKLENGKISVSMSNTVASNNSDKIQIAFVGKIIEPYIWLNDYSPIKNIRSGIYFDLSEIICLNPKTGQIWKINNPITNNKASINSKSDEIEIKPTDENLQRLKRILLSDPTNAEAYLGIGEIYFRQENLDESMSSLKRAIFWNSELIKAHILLGEIYLKKGECLFAKTYLEYALKIDNQNKRVIELQNKVEKCSIETNRANIDVKPLSNEIKSESTIDHKVSVENHRSFESEWEMKIISPNQSILSKFTVFKVGKKYKGFLTLPNRQFTETVTINFDGKNFSFSFSNRNSFFQKVKVKVEGIFNGNSIKGKMSIIESNVTKIAIFDSI